jgi:diketogulonate reductase-like aldo/keto reductase
MNREFPKIIYGTAWKKDATTRLVHEAVQIGFRAIDTANQPKHYQEALVGEALLALSSEGISRDQLFLQTKFTPADGQDRGIPYDPRADLASQVRQSFASSLRHLHVEYLDSYLLFSFLLPIFFRGLRTIDLACRQPPVWRSALRL